MGEGVNFGGRFWKIQSGGGSYGKSLPWEGGYGYFLEPHNLKFSKAAISFVTAWKELQKSHKLLKSTNFSTSEFNLGMIMVTPMGL